MHSRVDAELFEDVPQVGVGGVGGDEQLFGDLAICISFCRESGHGRFSSGQGLHSGLGALDGRGPSSDPQPSQPRADPG